MKRSKIDIVIDILEAASHGVNKTRIVYEKNLNFNLTNKYLGLLIEKGLIEKNVDVYTTTEEGKKFLKKAKDLIRSLEK